MLFFIISVSAADPVYVNTTGSDTDGDGSANNPFLTIQKGVNNVTENGTIYIANGEYTGVNNTNITIDKNLTIIGPSPGGTVIDAQGLNQIFHIQSGTSVYLEYLTFKNGKSDNGGAIYNDHGSVTVNRCFFLQNNASYGGAIYSLNGNTTVNKCHFICNNASYGGAIYSLNGNTTVNGGNFVGNNATAYGGAIWNGGDCYMIANVNNFVENNASWGGAIFNAATLNITTSEFHRNNASNSGGAIFNAATLNITSSTFNGNTAMNTGGAIWNNGGSALYVNKSVFIGNIANDGGAIGNNGNLTVTGSIFNDNSATSGNGGAIYTTGSNSNITGNTLVNNHAIEGNGGAIFISSGTVNVHFNSILLNIANSGIAISNLGGVVDAKFNWWDSNNPDFLSLINGTVDYTPWLYLTFNPNPTIIPQGSTSTLTASFNNLFNGNTITTLDPSVGHIPDGTPVVFATTLGNVGSKVVVKYTVNGIATAILRADEGTGVAIVSAYPLNATVTIIPAFNTGTSTVNAASKTIGMKETGIPINYLIIAILMVISSLIVPKRK